MQPFHFQDSTSSNFTPYPNFYFIEEEEEQKSADTPPLTYANTSQTVHFVPQCPLLSLNGTVQIITQSSMPPTITENALFPDLISIFKMITPKNSANESALSVCVKGANIPFDIEKFVLRLYNLLKTRGIILSEFKLAGGALRSLLLNERRRMGDIDFQAHVVNKKEGPPINVTTFLDAFTQVLDEIFFPDPAQQCNSCQERERRLRKTPNLLKTIYYNEDYLIITIPLQLQNNPTQPLQYKAVDIDIHFDFKHKSPCIASGNCFGYDLLRLFLKESPEKISVTGAVGYENSVLKAFHLLKKGQFFVHEPTVELTTNGLRAYAHLLVKGLFPVNYQSTSVYFAKWKKECEEGVSKSIPYEVNKYFVEFEKFLVRHYSEKNGVNLLHVFLYFINLRTIFATQDWSSQPWCYNKEKFLDIFDQKAFFLLKTWMPNITPESLTCIKLLIFWKIAAESEGAYSIGLPNSQQLLALKSPKGYGILTEIPWQETFQCDWDRLEERLRGLSKELKKMGLTITTKELKSNITRAMANPQISTSPTNNHPAILRMQKLLKFTVQETFNYMQFFSFILDAIQHPLLERTAALRELLSLIRAYKPAHLFQNLWEAVDKDIPLVFRALFMDLKGAEKVQKELYRCLSRPVCEFFREQTLLLIFPFLPLNESEKYFHNLKSMGIHGKQKALSDLIFYQLLIMALESLTHRKHWDRLFKYELPLFLEAAKSPLPQELLKAIGQFFNDYPLHPDAMVKAFLHLFRVGYKQEEAINSLASFLRQHPAKALDCFEELVDSDLFTCETLWGLFESRPFRYEDVHFLSSLSLLCLAKTPDFISTIESYWMGILAQHKLPEVLFQKLMLSSKLFQEKFTPVCKEQDPTLPLPSDLSLDELWKQHTEKGFFKKDTSKFQDSDWERFINLIHPSFKTASPKIWLPIFTDLIIYLPQKLPEPFKNFFQSLIIEEDFLDKILLYIINTSFNPVKFSQICMMIRCYHFYNLNGAKEAIADELVKELLRKIVQYSPQQVALQMFTDLVPVMSPKVLDDARQAFNEMVVINPDIYKWEKTSVLWEKLLIQFFHSLASHPLPISQFSECMTQLDLHFKKFENVIFSSAAIKKFANLSEMQRPGTALKIIVEYLNKMIVKSQKNAFPSQVIQKEWEELWPQLNDFAWTIEGCWELFKTFTKAIKKTPGTKAVVKTPDSWLFPTIGKKIAGFFKIQGLVCYTVSQLTKGKFKNDSKNSFDQFKLLHANFIQFYHWAYKQLDRGSGMEDRVNHLLNHNFKLHLSAHMIMLTEARHADPERQADYGQCSFELLNFVCDKKTHVFFEFNKAMNFVGDIGFIAWHSEDQQEKFFDLIVVFACLLSTFQPQQKEMIIINFVLRAVQDLMLNGQEKQALSYFSKMLPKHPSLRTPIMITSIDNYLYQIFTSKENQDQALPFNRIFGYINLITVVCRNNMSKGPNYQTTVLRRPLANMEGVTKLKEFITKSEISKETEEGKMFIEELELLSIRYKRWEQGLL